MSIVAIMLAMQMSLGGEECKVRYSLFADRPTWFMLDDSGIDDLAQTGVRYGEGDEA